MPYFRVDDKLHSHKKLMRAGIEAMGLWVAAASWAADQLTDGWVPDYVAERFTSHAEEYAARLVAAGLWVASEHEGDKGWYFHEWAEWGQPIKERVEEKRAEVRERVRQHRARKRADESDEAVTRYSDVSNAAVRPPHTHTHTQLPPVVPLVEEDLQLGDVDLSTSASAQKRAPRSKAVATRIPDDFSPDERMVAWAREKAPNADGRHETAQFKDYWTAASGKNAEKRDWVAAWRTWMRNADKRELERSSRRSATADGWDRLKDAD